MANEEHLAILQQGVKAWNRWQARIPLENPPFWRSDFIDADLSDRDLSGAKFHEGRFMGAAFNSSNLNGVDFWHASLSAANLFKTTLRRANLEDSILADAIFDYAHLSGANLRGSDTSFIVLRETKLDGADFSNCEMQSAVIGNCDLSKAIGLETVKHLGPSHIGIDTIYKSKGKIPESFLRGCGVPESFITKMHALVGAKGGNQFYSCFLSHSTRDKKFADRLYGRMQQENLPVWYGPEDIQGGKKLHEQIETAIRVYDKLLIVLSDASLQSEWVMTEIRRALKSKRKTGKPDLFPVRLVSLDAIRECKAFDAEGGKFLADELREYHIPDFSDWKNHDKFEAAFARLREDLRVDARAK